MLKNLHEKFESLASYLQSPLLLLLRLYLGLAFTIAGLSKLGNIQQTAEFFANINIPFAYLSAWIASLTEVIGGIALIFGFGTRLASLFLGFVMVVALLTAHYNELLNGLSNFDILIKLIPFLFLLGCLFLLAFGAGRFSLDRFIRNRE